MTLIVYRDGILASDSGMFWENAHCGTLQKVFRLSNGLLFGAAGDCDDLALRKVIEEHGIDLPRSELAKFNSDTQALIITPEGRVWVLSIGRDDDSKEGTVEYFQYDAPFYSLGHGRWMAFGAMAMGATAEQAVAAVIPYAVHTKGPVQKIRLHENKRKRRK